MQLAGVAVDIADVDAVRRAEVADITQGSAVADLEDAVVDIEAAVEAGVGGGQDRRARTDGADDARVAAGEFVREVQGTRAVHRQLGAVGDIDQAEAEGADVRDLDRTLLDIRVAGVVIHRAIHQLARTGLGQAEALAAARDVVREGAAEGERRVVAADGERAGIDRGGVREEARAGDLVGGLVEAREVEAGGHVGRQQRGRREAVVVRPADDAAGDLDARAVHVGLGGRRAQDEDAVAGLRERRGLVGETRHQAAVEAGRDAVVGDRDGAHRGAEVDLAGQADAGAGAAAAEGEVALDVDRVGDRADRAVAEQRGAAHDLERATADRAAGDGARERRRVGAEHQRAGREGEVGGEGALAAEGEDAAARLGERAHAGVLADHRGDRQARLGQTGVDGDDGFAGEERIGAAELERSGDVRHRDRRLVGRGDGVARGQDQLRAAGDQRIAHRAFVEERQRGQRVVAGEVERAAADEADVGGRVDLAFVGHHRDRRVGGRSQAADHEVARDDAETGRGVEVQRAGVDVGRARVGVIRRSRRRTETQDGAAGLDQVHVTRQQHVEVHRALVRVDVEVRTGRGERARAVGGLQDDRLIGVRHDTHAEGDVGGVERDRLRGARREAPGVGFLRAAQGTRSAVIVITRGNGGRPDVSTREARRGVAVVVHTHLRDAEEVGVGREGRTIGHGPAADEVVRHARGGEGRAVDLRQL